MFGLVMFSVSALNTEWWFDKRIHNFGNIGFTGMLHANVANFATRMIDKVAYNNRDIRSEILDDIPANSIVCDLGCGVGLSTFDNPLSYGVDTSDEMINVAKRENTEKSCTFVEGNAISYGNNNQFSHCTIFYILHEAPRYGRKAVLKNAMRIASEEIIIADIDPSYKPSSMMLSGEPYVINYLEHIQHDIEKVCKRNNWYISTNKKYLDKQVRLWKLKPNYTRKVKQKYRIVL